MDGAGMDGVARCGTVVWMWVGRRTASLDLPCFRPLPMPQAGGPATMCEPFLDSLMDSSSGAAAAAAAGGSAGSGAGGGEVWRRLMRDALRSAFAGPGKALGDATGLERPLVVLDRVTCTPRLQQCLVSWAGLGGVGWRWGGGGMEWGGVGFPTARLARRTARTHHHITLSHGPFLSPFSPPPLPRSP